MGTARSWRRTGTEWTRSEARRVGAREAAGVARWLSAPEQLEEFDWDSLRRVWDDDADESHEARATRSLTLINALLAERRRHRQWFRVMTVLLAPVAVFVAYRGLRQALA